MIALATEFPVRPIPDRASFIAIVVSWLRGASYSTVLDDPGDSDLAGDAAHLRSPSGEELRLREFGHDGKFEAIGFRHDFPDKEGRLWRTEAVWSRAAAHGDQDLIRLRTQCIARWAGARLEPPRKPYLVKTMLSDRWGGKDGELNVSDQPLWLADDKESLQIARGIALGTAVLFLPVVYVSAMGSSKWLISRDQAEKLAFDLGGIAHVVVEPNRAFSFQLRDLVDGANAYGGTLGIALPGRGIVRRFYLGLRLQDVDDLLTVVREASTGIRSQMPAEGWDWTELQEQALRRQRERDRNRLSTSQTEELYEEEIANLRDRIKQLEGQLSAQPSVEVTEVDEGLLPDFIVNKLGPELYPGEFSDRFRLAAKECTARVDQIGLDRRSKAVFDAIVGQLPLSPALSELLEDLKRATKDPKRVASELTTLLLRHGYHQKADNKHIRLEARPGYAGLEAITLPKTPSDHRGLMNLRKQVERTLGVTRLAE